jgi:hypothetical protein
MADHMKLCSTHKKLRLDKFLVAKNIFDADGNIVDVKYACHPDSECTNSAFVPRAAAAPFDSSNAKTAPLEGMSDAMKLYGTRETRGRYYDLSNQTGGIDDTVRKVCYLCGMGDHERGDCPNQFCRMCRCIVPPGGMSSHQCITMQLNDLIDMRTPTPDELKNVRCVICNRTGHLDCAKIGNFSHRVSCCACGEPGHHGFQCQSAPNDRWLSQQLRLLGATLSKRKQQPPKAYTYPSVMAEDRSDPSPGKKSNGKQKQSSQQDQQQQLNTAPPPPLVASTQPSGEKRKTPKPADNSKSEGDLRVVGAKVPAPPTAAAEEPRRKQNRTEQAERSTPTPPVSASARQSPRHSPRPAAVSPTLRNSNTGKAPASPGQRKTPLGQGNAKKRYSPSSTDSDDNRAYQIHTF